MPIALDHKGQTITKDQNPLPIRHAPGLHAPRGETHAPATKNGHERMRAENSQPRLGNFHSSLNIMAPEMLGYTYRYFRPTAVRLQAQDVTGRHSKRCLTLNLNL